MYNLIEMEMSPPPMPTAKKGMSPTGILLLVLGIIAALCVVLVGGCAVMMGNVMKQVSPIVGCAMTSQMIDKSIEAYALDNDGKLPTAAAWEDEIQPYYERLYKKSSKELEEAQKVPMVGGMFKMSKPGVTFQCGEGANATGFAFNADVSGAVREKIADPTTTPLFFEVRNVARNTAVPASQMPKDNPPEIMGDKRNWIVYYIQGNKDPFEGKSSSSSSPFEFDVDDARDPNKKK